MEITVDYKNDKLWVLSFPDISSLASSSVAMSHKIPSSPVATLTSVYE